MTAHSKLTEPIRWRGHRGGVITMHRAFTSYSLGPIRLLIAFSLFLFFLSIWIALLPCLCQFWTCFLTMGLRYLPLQAGLEVTSRHFVFLQLETPSLRMDPVLPDSAIWSVTCAATLLLFAGTFFLPKRLLPVAYLVRAVLGVQFTSLIYFLLWPSRFPHSPDSYMEALFTSGIGIITVVPLLFGLTYYIFDFGLLRKAFLTFLTIAHLSLFLPFQVLLQAVVLQKSLLFMPVLYVIFGMPLEVLLIIGFYSWGMTWSLRSARALAK
jgi:hypothetical protein